MEYRAEGIRRKSPAIDLLHDRYRIYYSIRMRLEKMVMSAVRDMQSVELHNHLAETKKI